MLNKRLLASTIIRGSSRAFVLGNQRISIISPKKWSLKNVFNRKYSPAMLKEEVQHKDFSLHVVKSGITNDDLTGERPLRWFTGLPPHATKGYDHKTGSLHSIPYLELGGENMKQKVMDYFNNTWTLTEVLYSSLQGSESFHTPPPHGLRHPLIFYYGHPACLYINKLRLAGLIDSPINPYFERVLETGVDEMSWDDMSKNHMAWPSVAEVHDYRQQVYNTVCEVINNTPAEEFNNINQDSKLWALVLAFEHERIHIETSSVLIRESDATSHFKFPRNWPAYHSSSIPTQPIYKPNQGEHYPSNEFISVKGETVTLGREAAEKIMKDTKTFGWDNEFGQRSYQVKDFKASKFLVSNGEYFDFVSDGGYSKTKYWTELGWKWRSFNNSKFPTFWKLDGPQGLHRYKLKAVFNEINMPYSWPVNVNFHEAKAFCAWKSEKDGKKYRLTTELEHHLLEKNVNDPVVNLITNSTMAQQKGVNLNLSYSSEFPVSEGIPSSKGFHDVNGNVWQWQEDYFSALDGFAVHPYYEDFSTPCFDGLHNIIKGGSFISTGNLASIHARYHFRPHFFQHAGFRVVESEENDFITSDTDAPSPFVGSYPFRETNLRKKLQNDNKIIRHLNSSLASQYGALPTTISNIIKTKDNFESNLLKLIKSHSSHLLPSTTTTPSTPINKSLLVGSSTGLLSFQLSGLSNVVQAIDSELHNIEAANKIKNNNGQVSFTFLEDGEEKEITISNSTLFNKDNLSKVDFRQADSSCLPAEYRDFDLVVLNNVIDKMPSPNSLLSRLDGAVGLVRKGGLLFVVTGDEWKNEITDKRLWLKSSELNDRLSDSFIPLHQTEMESIKLISNTSFCTSILKVYTYKRKD